MGAFVMDGGGWGTSSNVARDGESRLDAPITRNLT